MCRRQRRPAIAGTRRPDVGVDVGLLASGPGSATEPPAALLSATVASAHNGKHLLPHRPFVIDRGTRLSRACGPCPTPRACCAGPVPARAYCQVKAPIVGADTPGALSLCRATVHERLRGMGDRMTRGSGAAAIALMGCVAGCLASGTAGASVARAAPAAAAIRAASTAAAACEPHLDTYSRTQLCWRVGATVAVVRGATRVGTVTFDLTHDIQLDPRGRNWAERITISAVKVTGGVTAMTMSLLASCASPCSATDRFPPGVPITDGLTGVIDYSDAVGAGHADSGQTVYRLSFVKPGDRAAGFAYDTPISYRCDDALPGVPARMRLPRLHALPHDAGEPAGSRLRHLFRPGRPGPLREARQRAPAVPGHQYGGAGRELLSRLRALRRRAAAERGRGLRRVPLPLDARGRFRRQQGEP